MGGQNEGKKWGGEGEEAGGGHIRSQEGARISSPSTTNILVAFLGQSCGAGQLVTTK